MTRRFLTLIAVTAITASLLAQGPAGRFQRERGAEVITPGQQRLDVDVALLEGSQPFTVMSPGERFIATGGLNDLRLFSANGAEIPYLLVPPVPDVPQFVSGRVLPITATDTPNEKVSGFEVDFGALVATIDAIDLNRVPAPFLKRFRLEASGDRARWTQLIAEGTAFSLPAQQLAHTRIEFEPGEYRYVRVTWDDTNSGRVTAPDMVSARRVMRSSSGPILRAPIARGLAGRRAGAAADHRQRTAGPCRPGRHQRGCASHSHPATARAAARPRGRQRRQPRAAAGRCHRGVCRIALDLFRVGAGANRGAFRRSETGGAEIRPRSCSRHHSNDAREGDLAPRTAAHPGSRI
jgi:hypothetical protein